MRSLIISIVGIVALITVPCSRADSVQVGALSFNSDVPGALNDFEIDNFTGDNNLGGLLSSVADDVTFQNATLTVTCANAACSSDLGGNSEALDLGDLVPGFYTNTVFSAADDFLQAVFTATLNETTLNLIDGTQFIGSASLSETLLASNGTSLQPDVDSLVISDMSPSTAVPEPASGLLLCTGLLGIMAVGQRRLNQRN